MDLSRYKAAAGRAGVAVESVRKAATKPSVRPWLFGAAVVAFLGMAYVSFQDLDDVGRSAKPLYVLPLVLLAVPATLSCNALEYRAMARGLGHQMGFRDAMKVSLAATLANYLPAPGGVAIRTAALKGRGSTIGSAVSANAIAGILWLGVAGVIAGFALVVSTSLVARGFLAAVGGFAAIGGAAYWARRRRPGDWLPTFRELLVTEIGIVLVAGLRLWLALQAIGQPAPIGASIAIASATVIAAAVGIFPAGIGLREAVGGGIAVAVGVPWAVAVAALSVDRVAGPVGMALCAPFVGIRRRKPGPAAEEAEGPEGNGAVAPEGTSGSNGAGGADEPGGGDPAPAKSGHVH